MLALVIDPAPRVVHDHPAPVLSPGSAEALIRVRRAGVCDTDLQLARGYMGFSGVLGHEFVGIPESGPMKGQRVVGVAALDEAGVALDGAQAGAGKWRDGLQAANRGARSHDRDR